MKNIAILGGGGHCYALIELIREGALFNPVVILDKAPKTPSILGVEVKLRQGNTPIEHFAAIAVGNNAIRKKIAGTINVECPTFISSAAVCYPSAKLGKGVQVLPNAVVDAEVHLGDFTIVNNNATVSHNTVVEEYCHIAINAAISGGCHIGEGALIGAGSVLLPNISVGKWATVGAGAVVIKDVPAGATVVGNPAKIIKMTHE